MEHDGSAIPHHVAVRLSALGDVILTTGVLKFWHETRGMTFSVITRSAFAPVFEGHPAVCEVIGIELPHLRGRAMFGQWKSLARHYAGSTLVDLHGTGKTRLLSLIWRGRVHRYPKYSFERRLFLRTGGRLFRERLGATSVTQRYALALEPAGTGPPAKEQLAPCLFLSHAERAYGENLAMTLKHGTQPLVALHPYAAHPGKTWSPARWKACVEALEQAGMAWVVVGGGGIGEPVAGLDPDRDFTNRCTIRESAALLAACDALVTGDSGPMHLASAVGTPVVALFGPTTREWGFYPVGQRDVVLECSLACRPCSLHGAHGCAHGFACMEGISVGQVMKGLEGVVRL